MKKLITSWIFFFSILTLFSQSFPEGISFQAQVYNSNGSLMSNQTFDIMFTLRSNSLNGQVIWQETQTVTSNNIGHFTSFFGEGTSTGQGSATLFSNIDWSSNLHFLELLIDENSTSNFVSVSNQQLMAVPFAFHSKTTAQKFKLSQLLDIDTTNIQIGDVLKWNGTTWIASQDSLANDTVQYSYSSNQSIYSDTATFAYNCITPSLVDSSFYSNYSDSSVYATNSEQSIYSDSATFADTAIVALYSTGNWSLNGDSNTDPLVNYLGTSDSVDLILKTNNTERFRIKANGKVGIGTSSPLTDFHINNADGVLFTGTFGTGTIPVQGAGTRFMWYPKKAAFRSGAVTSNYWDDINIGNYSFASGLNTKAFGDYSVAFGNGSIAMGEGAFAVGHLAKSNGDYSFAAGHTPSALGTYSISLGRGGLATDTSSVAIGYHATANGKYAMCFSNYGFANGENSFAMGYHAQSLHDGAFIYADQSTEIALQTTANNQFMVRASGGYVFYTSSDLTTGVTLAPGAGAWSTLSDSTKKENINSISPIDYLNKLDKIEVYTWNYKSQEDNIKHIGPMAQDFKAVFDFGIDSTTINSGDFDGINLLLLKGLYEKIEIIENQNDKMNELEKELQLLHSKRLKLERLLIELEKKQNIKD